MGQFDHKVAIVTGAGGGIGQAYAEALARRVRRWSSPISTSRARSGSPLGSGPTAVRRSPSRSTSPQPDSAAAMADRTVAEFGGIDFLVNNAAIFGGMKLDMLVTVDWDYYKRFMSVNLDGALVCTRAVYKNMAARVAVRS